MRTRMQGYLIIGAGVVVVLVGLVLVIGNQTGGLPTFPYAGYIVTGIGFIVAEVGRRTVKQASAIEFSVASAEERRRIVEGRQNSATTKEVLNAIVFTAAIIGAAAGIYAVLANDGDRAIAVVIGIFGAIIAARSAMSYFDARAAKRAYAQALQSNPDSR